eukprot:3676355-Prymnesium_polylepis.1
MSTPRITLQPAGEWRELAAAAPPHSAEARAQSAPSVSRLGRGPGAPARTSVRRYGAGSVDGGARSGVSRASKAPHVVADYLDINVKRERRKEIGGSGGRVGMARVGASASSRSKAHARGRATVEKYYLSAFPQT